MNGARLARGAGRAAAPALGAVGLLSALAPAGLGGPPRLVWNATASAPTGAYWVDAGRMPAIGEWAAVAPPQAQATWLAARGYAPRGVLLIKQVAAAAPQAVCRLDGLVTIDGAPAARALAADHQGRPLPVWSGCWRLGGGDVLLLNADPRSLDGRYFGPTPRSAVAGRARRLAAPSAGDHAH